MTKAQIKQKASDLAVAFDAEYIAAMAVRLEILAAELKAAAKSKQINENILSELGVKLGETTRYDYSNSPAHVYLTEKLESIAAPIKAQIKDVEQLAKTLAKVWEKGGHSTSAWTDPETGEIFEVRPAVAQTSPKFELK